MYSDVFDKDSKAPKQTVEYYKKVQKTTTRTVYQDGKNPEHKVQTETYIKRGNNQRRNSKQNISSSNNRNTLSNSNNYGSNYKTNSTNSQKYSINSQNYTYNSKNEFKSKNYISNTKNNTYLSNRTNNFSSQNQRSNRNQMDFKESRSYDTTKNKDSYKFTGTVRQNANYQNNASTNEFVNRNGRNIDKYERNQEQKLYNKSQPKPIIKTERIIIRIQNKRRRKGDPVENFEYHETKDVKRNDKDSIVVHRRWGDPYYQLIDHRKKYSSYTAGLRGYRYSSGTEEDDYFSKTRNRTIDTDREDKYRYRNSIENNRPQKINASRITASSKNYNNYKTQTQETQSSRGYGNYGTQTQGTQSTRDYANYKTLTQTSQGTQNSRNLPSNKYNETHKRFEMTQKVDERRRYNPKGGYEGRYTEGAKRNTDYNSKRTEISSTTTKQTYTNTRNTSYNRNINDNVITNNNKRDSTPLNGRKYQVTESKREERKYNNIPYQKKTKENVTERTYKREINSKYGQNADNKNNSLNTEKYNRRNTNDSINKRISEKSYKREEFDSNKYKRRSNASNQNNQEQTEEIYERRTEKYQQGRYPSNKYGRGGENVDNNTRGYDQNYGKQSESIEIREKRYGQNVYGQGEENVDNNTRGYDQNYGKQSESIEIREKRYGQDEYGQGEENIDNNTRGYDQNYGKQSENIEIREKRYGQDEYGQGEENEGERFGPNYGQQGENLYQQEQLHYAQQINDQQQHQQQLMEEEGRHYCPVHGYHNIYDEEDQKEIQKYERIEGDTEGEYEQGGGMYEQRQRYELMEQGQRDLEQGGYGQDQALLQQEQGQGYGRQGPGFIEDRRGIGQEEGLMGQRSNERYELIQEQINNGQRQNIIEDNMNLQGQEREVNNYRFYESKNVTTDVENNNLLNERNIIRNEGNINSMKVDNFVGRGSGIPQEGVIDLSRIYIATKVTPVYSEIIDQQLQNMNYNESHVCHICGTPFNDEQFNNENEQGQGFVYNPSPYQEEGVDQQQYDGYGEY